MQTTLTSKWQMTLPKAAREALHLKPGQRLQVEVTADGGLLLRPIRLDPLSVATVLGRPPHKASLARAIDEAVAAAVSADWDRVTSGRDDEWSRLTPTSQRHRFRRLPHRGSCRAYGLRGNH